MNSLQVKIPTIFLGIWMILASFNILAEEVQSPSDILSSYLKSNKKDIENEKSVIRIIEKSQLITLIYDKDQPSKDSKKDIEFARSIKASYITPMSSNKAGDLYFQMMLQFDMFGGDRSSRKPEWLFEMKKPIEAGYKLSKVSVILIPSEKVKKESFAKSIVIAETIAKEVEKIKSDYGQLSEFNEKCLFPGEWKEDTEYPKFPSVRYKRDIGPNKKGAREKLSDNWCSFYFSIYPITGNPQQSMSHGIKYPLQGIYAKWNIESGSVDLNKKFNEIVKKSLKKFEDLEKRLEKENSEAGITN